jgi:hypothetical protein
MPPRTNLFQETIAMVHEHLAGEATIEESAMLLQRTTGEKREVDVVLRSTVAGHEVIVSIEARATARRADLSWVEMMLGKHADLPTSKLVLVSQAGFTGPAKRLAEAKGAVAVAPADLAGDHPGRRLIDQLAELSARELNLEAKYVILHARRPSGQKVTVGVPLDVNVYTADGGFITILFRVFQAEHEAEPAVFARAGNDLLQEGPLEMVVRVHPDPRWTLPGGIAADELYAHWRETDPPELQLIEEFEVVFDGAIGRAPTIEMTSRQLGDVAYSYGETTLDGRPALVVLTADETGGRLTVRPRAGSPRRSP